MKSSKHAERNLWELFVRTSKGNILRVHCPGINIIISQKREMGKIGRELDRLWKWKNMVIMSRIVAVI